MPYVCFKCGKEVVLEEGMRPRIRCPYCSSKILTKKRSGKIKRVLAK